MFWFPSKNMGGDTLESISKYRIKGAPLLPAFSSKHDGLMNLTCINVKMWDYLHLPLFSSQKKLRGWGDGSVYIVPATEVWVLSLNPHYPY